MTGSTFEADGARKRPLTRSTLYVTGLEPYVPTARPETKTGRLLWEIVRFRDACILLAGDRPYREYPAPWVIDHVRRAGFSVQNVKHFTIRYKARFVNAQIDISARRLKSLSDHILAQALKERGETLRAEALDIINNEGGLRFCRNYVIAAEPVCVHDSDQAMRAFSQSSDLAGRVSDFASQPPSDAFRP